MDKKEEEEIIQLKQLGCLDSKINFNEITSLKLNKIGLVCLPQTIHYFVALKELDLSENKLCSIPEEIGLLTNLQMLNLMSNQLEKLPSQIGQLIQLKNLGLKNNQLSSLPSEIGCLTNLIGLFLTNNKLKALPSSIGNLKKLRKLQVAENQISVLPSEISHLECLELMRMPGNQLVSIPPSFAEFPQLCWITLSNNPLSCTSKEANVKIVSESPSPLGELLGSGASGSVYKALEDSIPIAIKIFKDEISPDGRYEDEIQVTSVLDHPNLPKVHAIINGKHKGMVMNLLDGKPLAGRPDFSSFLRSKYPLDLKLSRKQIYHIGEGISNAMGYLHALGICHGDLYAHNILFVPETCQVWLCDFGAAFFYSREICGEVFEKMEVRAFGILCEELKKLYDSLWREWDLLIIELLHSNPHKRPTFQQITLIFNQTLQAYSNEEIPATKKIKL